MTRASVLLAGAAALAACHGTDPSLPIDAPIDALEIDAPPLVAPVRVETCGAPVERLDFPRTAVGQVAERTLTFFSDAVDWQSVRITQPGGSFAISATQFSVHQGEPAHVVLTFRPTVAGVEEAALVIEQNGAPTREIALLGEAVSPGAGLVAAVANIDFTHVDPTHFEQPRIDLQNRAAVPIRLRHPVIGEHFRMVQWACDDVLAPGASCFVRIAYDPIAPGCQVGSFILPSDVDPAEVALSGPARTGRLHVDVRPSTAAGVVTSQPAGLDCASWGCSGDFPAGTEVTLTAETAVFGGWNEPSCGMSPTCTVALSRPLDQTVRADMVLGAAHTIAVTIDGAGEVSSMSADGTVGVTCRSSCSMPVAAGSPTMLVATGHDRFTGWAGACSGTGTCPLVLDDDRAVTASFAPASSAVTWAPAQVPEAIAHLPGGVIATMSFTRLDRIDAAGMLTASRNVLAPGGFVVDLQPSSDGGVFVLTTTFAHHTLYRVSAAGEVVWRRRWQEQGCTPGPYRMRAVAAIAGRVGIVIGQQLFVVDDATGADAWSAVVPDCREVAAGPDGMFAVTRAGQAQGTRVVRRYAAAAGTVLGPDLPVPGLAGSGIALAVDASGAVVTHSAQNGVATLARTTAAGEVVFLHEQITSAEVALFVIIADDGTIVFAHSDTSNTAVVRGASVRRYAADGTLLSSITWPAATFGPFGLRTIFLDLEAAPDGRVTVAGTTTRAGRGRMVDAPWLTTFTFAP